MQNISELFNDRKVNSPSISSGTLTLDLSTGRFFNVSLNANVTTLTISNVPSSVMTTIEVIFTQDSTGGRTITWPSSVKFANGLPVVLNKKPSNVSYLKLVTANGGSTWICVDSVLSTVNSAYTNAALKLSPGGLYLMEEASGTSMLDTSGNARNGTYIGSVLPTSSSLLAEGTLSLLVSNTQYATVPIAVCNTISNFTISFWVSFTATSNTIIIECNQNAGWSIQTDQTSYGGNNGGLILTTTYGSVSTVYIRSSIAINDGNPHHVVFVVGTNQASSYIFIDGVDRTSRPTLSGTQQTTYGSATYWDVGSRGGTATFGGRLDGLAFFPGALTYSDAQSLYQAGKDTTATY